MCLPIMDHLKSCVMSSPIMIEQQIEQTPFEEMKKKICTNIFLGLDDSIFHTIISQKMNMNPLLSVNIAYQMVIREKCHSLITRGKDKQA